LTVERKYQDAISLFSANLPDAASQGMPRLPVGFLADRAWCKLKLGMRGKVAEHVPSCVAAVRADRDPHDWAVALRTNFKNLGISRAKR
jgi:hypothetical protein